MAIRRIAGLVLDIETGTVDEMTEPLAKVTTDRSVIDSVMYSMTTW